MNGLISMPIHRFPIGLQKSSTSIDTKRVTLCRCLSGRHPLPSGHLTVCNRKWPIDFDYYLVGGRPTPLNNMKVSWDDDSPNMEKYKYVPNHQPVIIHLLISISIRVIFHNFANKCQKGESSDSFHHPPA